MSVELFVLTKHGAQPIPRTNAREACHKNVSWWRRINLGLTSWIRSSLKIHSFLTYIVIIVLHDLFSIHIRVTRVVSCVIKHRQPISELGSCAIKRSKPIRTFVPYGYRDPDRLRDIFPDLLRTYHIFRFQSASLSCRILDWRRTICCHYLVLAPVDLHSDRIKSAPTHPPARACTHAYVRTHEPMESDTQRLTISALNLICEINE